MKIEDDICYRALRTRDSRFDGLFFVGVKTTGIYCRPICTARTPEFRNCSFFPSAVLAEQAGLRPCLKCRPELAPGFAPVDRVRNVAHVAASRIDAGALSNGGNIEDLATSLGLTSRHLRRAIRKELGVSAIELAQTNRLLLAKRLIAETQLPMTSIAFAAGFKSVRRFNALFAARYRLTPSHLRRASSKSTTTGAIRLLLSYRPPLQWEKLLRFLAARAITGVEHVADTSYYRTVAVGSHRGWLHVAPVAERNQLAVELDAESASVVPVVLAKLRHFFDLDAQPDIVDSHLAIDDRLAASIRRYPGLRIPGAFDSFELAMRTILGQQISVRGATTLSGRIAERFGEPTETPHPFLTHVTPSAGSIASARVEDLTSLGLTRSRACTLIRIADAINSGEIVLEPGVDPVGITTKLTEISGIGPWTAEYIAMRALRWPDSFPASDLGLLKAAGLTSAKAMEQIAERWRPWRAYAAMHLWNTLETTKRKTERRD